MISMFWLSLMDFSHARSPHSPNTSFPGDYNCKDALGEVRGLLGLPIPRGPVVCATFPCCCCYCYLTCLGHVTGSNGTPLQYSCLENPTEEPSGLQSMGLLRVRHDWATSLSLFTFTHWRRKWQPTPVFLPGESQGRGSLVGFRLWGHIESDTTEAT